MLPFSCPAGAAPQPQPRAVVACAYRVRLSHATTRRARAGALRRPRGAAVRVLSGGSESETLVELDALLERCRESGDADGALELRAVELLRADSTLRGFGTGRLVPKRDYTLAEMRLNKVEPQAFLSPRDTTLEDVRNKAAAAFASGALALGAAVHPSSGQLLAWSVGVLTLLMMDQVGNGGAGEALILDTLGNATSPGYRKRIARHEAGHFLVAWLCGIVPRAYTLSAVDALRSEGALNVQAGTQFADKAFQREVAGGTLSSASLDVFCCIALAGVASEVLAFGQAEGGLNDVRQLDGLLQALAFTQKRADSQVRWAALATTALLRRHTAAHDALEAAMVSGASVGACVSVLEKNLGAEL